MVHRSNRSPDTDRATFVLSLFFTCAFATSSVAADLIGQAKEVLRDDSRLRPIPAIHIVVKEADELDRACDINSESVRLEAARALLDTKITVTPAIGVDHYLQLGWATIRPRNLCVTALSVLLTVAVEGEAETAKLKAFLEPKTQSEVLIGDLSLSNSLVVLSSGGGSEHSDEVLKAVRETVTRIATRIRLAKQ